MAVRSPRFIVTYYIAHDSLPTLIKVLAGTIATFAVAYTMDMVLPQIADRCVVPEIGEAECN